MIDFIVYDMSHLRYFAPFAVSLKRLGFKTRWLISRSSVKYNSIHSDRVSQVEEIGRAAGCEIFDVFDQNASGRCAITIETGTPSDKIPSRYDAVLSMQHGFDYTTRERSSGENVLNVMWDQIYADHHATIKKGCKYLVPPTPVPFWIDMTSARDLAGPGRIATVFYPEHGYHSEAMSVCVELLSQGITPIVKQRRKNQTVPQMNGCEITYDEIWHPSESIFYPVCSEICVGFGTSAYADAVAAGLTFVDCTAPKYSASYLKPTSDRYFQCQVGDQVQTVKQALQNKSCFIESTQDERDEFVDLAMRVLIVQRA